MKIVPPPYILTLNSRNSRIKLKVMLSWNTDSFQTKTYFIGTYSKTLCY